MEEIVFFNGNLLPRSQARVSVFDYGFLFGYGLYETIRAYDGRLFRLDAHLDRLHASAQTIGIRLDIPLLKNGVLDTVKANAFSQTRVRITVSIGEGTMTPDLRSCQTPTVLVLAGEYHPSPLDKYEHGFKTAVSSIRRNSRSPVTRMKSANSMENMLARKEAKDKGADEVIFLNDRSYITEASGSNLFLVKNGILKTPRTESGILPGVTRAAMFSVAGDLSMTLSEADIPLGELEAADEALLTNSLIEVMPVVDVGGKVIGSGQVGPVTRRLIEAYRNLVMSELRAQ